jgi:hypothetical protein
VSGFGVGLGAMSAYLLMDLLLSRFNYIGFGFEEMFGGYDTELFNEIDEYYPGEEEEVAEEEEAVEEEEAIAEEEEAAEDEEYFDPGNMGEEILGGRRRIVRRNMKNKKNGPGRPRKFKS